MPYVVRKIGGKYRLIEKATGKIGKNKAGTAIDGGGSTSKAKLDRQRDAVNISYAKKHGAKIPRKKK